MKLFVVVLYGLCEYEAGWFDSRGYKYAGWGWTLGSCVIGYYLYLRYRESGTNERCPHAEPSNGKTEAPV